MTKKWYVSVPFTGYTTVEVEADTRQDAIAAAWESPDLTIQKCDEAEFTDRVVKGNVTYAVMNEIEVSEVTEEDD